MNRSKNTGQRGAKGDGRRLHRVEKEIREVIGAYLLRGFRGELPGIVSVSRVIVSKDLRNAKVLITLMVQAAVTSPQPVDDEKVERELKLAHERAVHELQAHAPEIQAEVNRRLQMKHCPRLSFHYDDGFEHALRVESILRDLKLAREGSASTPGAGAGAGAEASPESNEDEE